VILTELSLLGDRERRSVCGPEGGTAGVEAGGGDGLAQLAAYTYCTHHL
jgi:hypothetical protein